MTHEPDLFVALQNAWNSSVLPALVPGGNWQGRAGELSATPYAITTVEHQQDLWTSGVTLIQEFKLTVAVYSTAGVVQGGNIRRALDGILNRQNSANFIVPNSTGTLDVREVPGKVELDAAIINSNDVLVAAGSWIVSVQASAPSQITGPAAALRFSAPATVSAGAVFAFTVTAVDLSGNTVPGYTGTVAFNSGDYLGTVPAPSVLTNGVGIFTAALESLGSQFIAGSDAAGIGGAATLTCNAGTRHLVVNFGTYYLIAGAGHVVNIFATTGGGIIDTTYNGTVHFTSTDHGATLPANLTLVSGVGTASATLVTAASRQTLTATDTISASITGHNPPLLVLASSATKYMVSAPANATTGAAFGFTVTRQDAFSNTVTTGFTNVQFASSDTGATLPSQLAIASGGVGVATATLATAGLQTLTAVDSVVLSLTGNAAIEAFASGGTVPHFALTFNGTTQQTLAGFDVTVTAKNANGTTNTGYVGNATISLINGNDQSNPSMTWTGGGFPSSGGPFVSGVFVFTAVTGFNGAGATGQLQVQDNINPAIVGVSPVITWN